MCKDDICIRVYTVCHMLGRIYKASGHFASGSELACLLTSATQCASLSVLLHQSPQHTDLTQDTDLIKCILICHTCQEHVAQRHFKHCHHAPGTQFRPQHKNMEILALLQMLDRQLKSRASGKGVHHMQEQVLQWAKHGDSLGLVHPLSDLRPLQFGAPTASWGAHSSLGYPPDPGCLQSRLRSGCTTAERLQASSPGAAEPAPCTLPPRHSSQESGATLTQCPATNPSS